MDISVGKYRRIQQISKNGLFKVVALDHREVFVDMLANVGKKHEVNDIIDEKLEIIRNCRDNVTGFLVDPHYALPKCLLSNILPGKVGFMINYEDNDYSIENFSEDYFIKNFTVRKAVSLGASIIKVFLYFDPYNIQAKKQIEVIQHLSKECQEESIPLLIEPVLSCSDNTSIEERIELNFKMLESFKGLNIDVFKIRFFGDIKLLSEEENLKICQKVTKILSVPWTIMSFGSSIKQFAKELEISCKGGASGYIAGRALWKDFVLKKGMRDSEIKELKNNIKLLNEITDKYGRKWIDVYTEETLKYNQGNWYNVI